MSRKFHALRNLIAKNINGATIISLDTVTDVILRGGKQNPQQGRVTKHCTGHNVMIFQNKTINGYDAMVRRRLVAEGKNPDLFVLSPRQWGERIEGEPFVYHKGNYYLEVIFLKAGKVHYMLDEANPIEKEDIIGLPDHVEGEQGGLENKVIIRTYSVESLRAITIGQTKYNIVEAAR